MQSIDHLFNCECCGGRLIEIEDKKFKCDHCGQIRYIETTASTQVISMLNQANILRNKGEFDDAFDIFNDILSIESENADAYWGMFLSTFGVMHVLDPKTNTYLPTCNRCSEHSALDDDNYKRALQLANANQAELFTKTATSIEKIRNTFIKECKNEKPYDIFICYKRTLSVINGREVYTEDSVCARDIYDILTAKGYKVFFAEKTLQNLAGSEYEPIIYNALKTSKVMLVISSETELLNSPWVKNEWLRFIKQMEYDSSKKLIPIMFNGMKATSLPDKLKKFQGLEINASFQTYLLNAVEKAIKKEQNPISSKPLSTQSLNTQTDASATRKLIEEMEERKIKQNKKNQILFFIIAIIIALSVGIFYISSLTSNYNNAEQDGSENNWQDESGNGNNNQPNTSIGYEQYKDDLTLATITIPKDITHISDYAFQNCKNLESVIFEEGSNLSHIGNQAFSGCSKLSTITLPSSLTNLENAYACFENCTSLATINIPDSVTIIPSTFLSGCTSLESVQINSASQLTSIGHQAFENCSSLCSFNIPRLVTYISDSAFYYCDKLVEINNLSSITLTLGSGIASNAINITSKEDFTSNITTLNNVKYYKSGSLKIAIDCSNDVENIVLDDTCVKIHKNAFENKTNLLSVYVSDNVSEIEEYAFSGCVNLTTIRLPKNLIKANSYDFGSCIRLTEVINLSSLNFNPYFEDVIIVTNDVNYTSKITTINNVRYFVDNNKKIAVSLADKSAKDIVLDSNCTEIYSYAFYNEDIKSITIPNSVTKIGTCAFQYCTLLDSVTFSENSTLEHISTQAFSECSKLTNITIPASVNLIDINAFDKTSLNEVEFKNYNAWSYKIESYSTASSPINEIDLKDKETAANYLSNMFANKYWERFRSIGVKEYENNTELTTITISKDVGYIYDSAFKNCINLESVIFEYGSRLKYIGSSAFENCSKLKEITIPAGVETINSYAFNNCTSLNRVYFENNSKLKTISNHAFKNCNSLTRFDVQPLVETIDTWAFDSCYRLVEINNLSNIVLSYGSWDYGYIAQYALKINNSQQITSNLSWENYIEYLTIGSKKYAVNCDNEINSITLNNTCNVINKYAFYNRLNLYTFTNKANITTIPNYAFLDCYNLSTYVAYNNPSISSDAFYRCYKLVQIINLSGETLSTYLTQNALRIETSLSYVSYIKDVNNVRYYLDNNNNKIALGCIDYTASEITIASKTTKIHNYAFTFSNIKSINIPETVTKIGWNAFYECNNLSEINFEDAEGWKFNDLDVDELTLSNPSLAAIYLRQNYNYAYIK